MANVIAWMEHYGYLVLFLTPMLELIALPVSAELVMGYSGVLVFEGRLHWLPSIIIAGLGSSIGITLTYLIGYKLGTPFFHKYGSRIHMGPDKLEKVSKWFERYGNKVITIAYFIPGVRHITGYFSGITRIPFRTFALFAYVGAFLWSTTFVSLGKVLGPRWEHFHGSIKKYLMVGGVIAAVAFAIFYVYKTYRPQIFARTKELLNKALELFHSLGRVRALVASAAVVFLGLFILMISLIEDFLRNEFTGFDTTIFIVIQAIFSDSWLPVMKGVSWLTTYQVLISLLALAILMIFIKGRHRGLEAAFLLTVFVGGEALGEGLRRIFHRIGPSISSTGYDASMFTFPSEQSLIALAVYGFIGFLLFRHVQNPFIKTITPILVLSIAIIVGVSRIFLGLQYPSDVVAGWVFGGAWLSLDIALLEIYRQLRRT